MLHTVFTETLADDHRRELRELAATRPRPVRTGGALRTAVGRRLVAFGLRLCLPTPHGVPQEVLGQL